MIRAEDLARRLAALLSARGKIANFTRDCIIMDDADGLPPRLVHWNAELLGAEPTQEEVDAVDVAPVLLNVKRDQVDAAAERARLKYVPHITVVPEYQQAEAEAAAFKRADYTGDVPPTVATWAQAKQWTAQQAADDILLAAAMLRGKLMQIRAARLIGKEAIGAGTKTLEEVLAELAEM